MAMNPDTQAAIDAVCRTADQLAALQAVVAWLWKDTGRTENDASAPMWTNAETSAILGALHAEAQR